MNKVAKTLSLVAILLTLASATAWAAIECTAGSACQGTDGPNTMYGSASEDRIYGKGGADVIDATGGVDEVYGGDGHDAGLYGGNGQDLVQGGAGEARNTVRGGRGFDICYVDKYDRVKGCEREY